MDLYTQRVPQLYFFLLFNFIFSCFLLHCVVSCGPPDGLIDTSPYRPGLVDFLVVVRFMGGIKGGKHSLVHKGTHTHPTNPTKKSRDYYYITKQLRIVVCVHTLSHTIYI